MTINNMAAVIPIASLVAVAALAALLCYCIVLRKLLSGSTPAETVLRSIREAFILVDANAGFLSANESAVRLFPPLKTLKTGAPIAGVENWPAGLHTPADTCDSPPTMFSLHSRYYSASVSRVTARKRQSPGYAILIQDITEAAHLTKKIKEIAYTDKLTGINNLRHFMILASTQVERMKRAGGSAYIIIFDLDRFSEVNEAHGHAVGDKVLKAVANIIHDTVRPYDLFARYGGEEFILFISDISEKDIRSYTERVRLAVSNNQMTFEEAQLTITASFGIATLIPKEGLETAIKTANEAMCMAKKEGRNKVVMLDGDSGGDAAK